MQLFSPSSSGFAYAACKEIHGTTNNKGSQIINCQLNVVIETTSSARLGPAKLHALRSLTSFQNKIGAHNVAKKTMSRKKGNENQLSTPSAISVSEHAIDQRSLPGLRIICQQNPQDAPALDLQSAELAIDRRFTTAVREACNRTTVLARSDDRGEPHTHSTLSNNRSMILPTSTSSSTCR